jgi:hypothetical protein
MEWSFAQLVRQEFDIPLEDWGRVIRVRIVREAKTVVDFVAQYEAFIDGRYRPVIRYDGSHGRPHRDTLGWNGETIDKRWAPPGMTYNHALTVAIDDIEAHAEDYLVAFLRRRP